MLVIRADLVEELVAHARRDFPREACGQLFAADAGDPPQRYVPMTNADDPGEQGGDYSFDTGEQIRAHREAVQRGDEGEPVVIFHSHTRVPRRPLTDSGRPEAYPSVKDIRYMAESPQAAFVIVALAAPDAAPELRSFRLCDEAVRRVMAGAAGEVDESDLREDDVQVTGPSGAGGDVERYMLAHTGVDDVPDRD